MDLIEYLVFEKPRDILKLTIPFGHNKIVDHGVGFVQLNLGVSQLECAVNERKSVNCRVVDL